MTHAIKLPFHEYTITEKDFLRMLSCYAERKQGYSAPNKHWFNMDDYVLTIEIEEGKR